MSETSLYTVITGASKGLGESFAVECAKKHRNLILVSLPNESIHDLADKLIKKYGIKAVGYEVDLTDKKSVLEFTGWVTDNYEINMLISNAGIGGTNSFTDWSVDYIDTLIQLNIRALVLVTHQLLPLLKKHSKSNIINISSLAGLTPIPYKTIYPASKAFVASFSNALNSELEGTGVVVSAAYPGGMPTNPEMHERLANYKGISQRSFMSSDDTAKIFLHKALKGKTRIVPSLLLKFSRFLIRLVPMRFQLSIFKKKCIVELKDRGISVD